MPQLPSGRHIGLDPTPLREFVARMQDSPTMGELLVIEKPAHLLRYIGLLYFVAGDEDPALEFSEGALPLPGGLRPVHSGYTLATMQGEVATWSEADQAALAAFLAEDRTQAYLKEKLDALTQVKQDLHDHGTLAQRHEMAMWHLGAHPLNWFDDHKP